MFLKKFTICGLIIMLICLNGTVKIPSINHISLFILDCILLHIIFMGFFLIRDIS